MCRLLAYCSRVPASLADLMGADGLRDFTALSCLHGDGWGNAWYQGTEPAIRKNAAAADGDPEYEKLAWQPLSDLGLVHLRWATPGLAVDPANTHPFRYGDYVFAHNGAIHPQDRLSQMLPPEWEQRIGGTTDSERYFLQIMRLAERDGDVVAAISGAIADIRDRFEPNSLNAMLMSPEHLYVIAWHDPARIPGPQLRARGYQHRPDDIASYFDLTYRATEAAVVVASSGWPMPGWTGLPSGHVLIVERRSLSTSVVSLDL
jgi:predicted glutamine amidotransferase